MAILNRFSAILLYCDSTHFLLLAAEFLAIPGPRFWESCDSRFAILNQNLPELFEEFQRFVYWRNETTKNSLDIPANCLQNAPGKFGIILWRAGEGWGKI